MESIKGIVVFLVLVLIAVVTGSAVFGYACRATEKPHINPKEFRALSAEGPCQPVFPGGEHNPHYQNAWESCRHCCKGGWFQPDRFPMLDQHTCECVCKTP